MSDGNHALYYSDDLMTNLQLRYGEGMLSPGGAEELARLIGPVEVAGKTGLDLGCGIGGYDTLMVAEHGVGKVVGVDINAAAVDVASRRAHDMGLSDKVTFMAVDPGPLPFEDESFDFVFSKDSIVDIPEKASVMAELFRVVGPGGHILISDWFCSDAPYTPEMRDWATTGEETYEMASLRSTADDLAAVGFVAIETEDRGDWFIGFCREELALLSGALWQTYVDKFGEDSAHRSVRNAQTRLLLAKQGQLLTGHIRARKPG